MSTSELPSLYKLVLYTVSASQIQNTLFFYKREDRKILSGKLIKLWCSLWSICLFLESMTISVMEFVIRFWGRGVGWWLQRCLLC